MRSTLILICTAFLLHTAKAQCPGCVADVTCTVSPAYPALCPLQPPDATAGEYYETDITFWLPVNFSDPGSGLTVNFDQMTITNISGLPFGLSIETSEPTGIYYPPQSEYGCARICGIPLGAGTYDINISIVASVSVGGFPVNSPETFTITLVVLPGSGANSGFSFTPNTGCGSAEVSFEALIDASPQITQWDWDFGNGNSSDLASPPVQSYDEPGTYEVSLTTTISGYVLNTVVLTNVNDNWCGDVEEPFCNCGTPIIGTCPDLYYVLTDANGNSFTSNTVGGTTSATWNNVGLPLNNPPYNISFWDEDVISQNDHLGTFNIPLSGPGTYPFNVAGGTTGSLVIGLEVLQQFNDVDSIVVFPLPEVVLAEDAGGDLCAENPDLIGFIWLLDGDTIPGATTACITPDAPGVYQVLGTDGFGCQAASNTVVICPDITITRTGNILSVPAGFITYAWTFNGASIPGADQPFLVTQGDGLYTVSVDAGNGCEVTAEFDLNTVGIAEQDASSGLHIYPNPGRDLFTLDMVGVEGATAHLEVIDMTGRIVHRERLEVANGRVQAAFMLDVPAGNYLVQVVDRNKVRTERLVVQ
jgi:hypothetical protein